MITELLPLLFALFLGRPYVASTLEPAVIPAQPEAVVEPLVVNHDSVDCTTLVEYFTAAILSNTAQPSASDSAYLHMLQRLRYRQGRRGHYATRKHYFSEWIADGEAQHLLTDVTAQLPGARSLQRDIHFMSRHPQSYPQLAASAALVDSVRIVEQLLSANAVSYLPKAAIATAQSSLQHGDIVTFLTSIDGLDVQHVGLVWRPTEADAPRLYHASTARHEVIIDRRTIAEYAADQRTVTGIRVIRIQPQVTEITSHPQKYNDMIPKVTAKLPSECTSITEVRQQIDNIDQAIIGLIGQRAHYVHEVVKYKDGSPASIEAPDRRLSMMTDRRAWAEAQGLAPALIDDLFDRLVQYFIEEEKQIVANQKQQ